MAECKDPGPKLLDRDSQLAVLSELVAPSELVSTFSGHKLDFVLKLISFSLIRSSLSEYLKSNFVY